MIKGWDFYDEWSRFSWWMIDSFLTNVRDLDDDWSRVSWWMVDVFLMIG